MEAWAAWWRPSTTRLSLWGYPLGENQCSECVVKPSLGTCHLSNVNLANSSSNDQKPNLLRAERHGYAARLDWDTLTGE